VSGRVVWCGKPALVCCDKMPDKQLDNKQKNLLLAPLLAACWVEAGFGAKRPRISQERGTVEVEVSYIDCVGDVCNQRSLWVRLYSGGKLTTMPSGLPARLMMQPLALLALAGMSLLGCCLAVKSPVSDAVLSLLGGHDMGLIVFSFAVLAHLFESAYCFVILQGTLRQPLGATLAWSFMVALVGWPVSRHVIQLKKVVPKPSKAA